MKGRSTVEVMVLMLTFTVCFGILATGATIAVIEIRDPSVDTSSITQSLLSLVSGILGALLGLLAGKAENVTRQAAAIAAEAERVEQPPPEPTSS